MFAYDIEYSDQPNVIPANAIKMGRILDNIGTVYLVHHSRTTDIYLDYSIGKKIEKPKILLIDELNRGVRIMVKRPNNAIANQMNFHCFKIRCNKRVVEVDLAEFI